MKFKKPYFSLLGWQSEFELYSARPARYVAAVAAGALAVVVVAVAIRAALESAAGDELAPLLDVVQAVPKMSLR